MADTFVMLAPTEQLHHLEVKYPVFVQRKLDGIRAVLIDRVFYSRNMKPIRNAAIQKIAAQLPNWTTNYVFDGEWYAHGRDFNQIQGVVMDEEDDLTSDFNYVTWDVLSKFEWECRVSGQPYVTRFNTLGTLLQRLRTEDMRPAHWFERIDNLYIGNPLVLANQYMSILEEGYEGVMLKSPTGSYKWGRCTVREHILLKYKPTFTLDLPITHVVEGTGKWKSAIGAIHANLAGVDVAFGPGKTVTEAYLRRLWKKRERLPGMTVEVYHSGVTKDGSFRFPKFKTVRLDK